MKSIKLKLTKNEQMFIEWEGYKTRWEMLENLLLSLFRYYMKRKPHELERLLGIIQIAYEISKENNKK